MKTIIFITSLLVTSILAAQQIGDGRAIEITDFSAPLKSGAYQGSLSLGMNPDTQVYGWQHLFVIRHSNDANNHQLQLSSSYTMNDRLFFRKIAGGLESNNPIWIELATRGVNSFTGNQSIIGNLNVVETNESRPEGQNAATKSILKLSRNGTSNYSWNEYAEFRIGHGSNSTTGSKLDLYINGIGNTTSIPDQHVMTWNCDGSVGIGTTTPTSKLTVAGNINSREVKVTVDAGADFVFEKDYNLPSLESLDKFIKENKHLPEIASADEMKKNGINLSEMNIKLLQKIEELTLYLIEMKKENEKQIAKQNEEIKILKTKIKSK